MWKLSQVFCACYLLLVSVFDIRNRCLPVCILVLGAGAAAFYQMIFGTLPGILSLAGAAVGIVFLCVSKVTEEAFGYGDSFLILVLGIYLGFWKLLCLLVVAFTLAAGFAMIVLAVRHFKRKTVFPFVPFLGAGYVLLVLFGGG